MSETNLKTRVARLSVISNSTLVVLKLAVGLFIGSVAIISEAIHSGVDLLAAIIAYFAVRSSSQPPDKDHPYGHGKFENLSGTVEAILIFFAAAWIIYESAHKLMNPEPINMVGWGVAVMGFSAVVNLFVSKILFIVGQKTDSIALIADAWHLRTDVWTSFGVMAALGVIVIASIIFPGVDLSWIDPVGAILVALIILRAAYELTIQSVRDLADVSLPPEEEKFIADLITSHSTAILGFHKLRTRKSGSDRFVEFHLNVDGRMSVTDSHRITDELTRLIRDKFPKCSVTIHIEPCDHACRPTCKTGCLQQPEKK